MKNICDLFIKNETNTNHFRHLTIFDKSFLYIPGKFYSGYLGLNVERITLVSVVIELKKEGVVALNVPIRYRDNTLLSVTDGFNSAKEYGLSKGLETREDNTYHDAQIPLYWTFPITNNPPDKAGGVIYVDKLDGHIWTYLEHQEYMYDYNNII
ncbi:hypothetical protein [Limnobaculum parvum]|uniref:Uncharacterized protein n=1 Tax=Limnobaculum parvum TaxID=2172103 RepID=A0A2Y9TY30_9GAMM|nr:hypothetical protein [Limnobaculum parvum]AWH88627.1 hypothetical protein HYN51_08670 [Limnobaculum parvum]